MSLKIIKAGIFDTIQDNGRYGYQHLGINPGGVMDRYSAGLANALLGKDVSGPVLEMHFPAAQILIEQDTILCITGAHFSPVINEQAVSINHPVVVSGNSILEFKKWEWGARCYVSFLHSLQLQPWLGSYSTHLKVGAGGHEGRLLKEEDRVLFGSYFSCAHLLKGKDFVVLPWQGSELEWTNTIDFIRGNEWDWLPDDSLRFFEDNVFHISGDADRMGYRLTGKTLKVKEEKSLVSSPVNFGTMQLLPNGQLIILMADHQTTGGYPRVGHVVAAYLPMLAQLKPRDALYFCLTDLESAESEYMHQQKKLRDLQIACKFKLENLFDVALRS
jgi:antagonist of KipI